jgi:hypothetical protein
MKLDALFENQNQISQIVSKFTNGTLSSIEEISQYLKKDFGMTDIKSGQLSTAFINPSNQTFVVKISNDKSPSDPFWGFIKKYQNEYQNNSIFPVIYAQGVINGFKYCIMEYLWLRADKLDDTAYEMGYKTFSRVMMIFYLRKDVIMTTLARNIPPLRDHSIQEITKKIEYIVLQEFKIDVKKLDDFLNKAEGHAGISGYEATNSWFDIHANNVGFRRNGEFVIFDPIGPLN